MNTKIPYKPLTTKAKKRQTEKERRLKKMYLNMDLKAVCTHFQMPPLFSYYFLNRTTTIETLSDLIHMANTIDTFTIDTENDQRNKKPALIQIEFVNHHHPIVVLIELFHLPKTGTYQFDLFRSLFRIILSATKTIQTWGPITDELSQCIHYGLFNNEDIVLPTSFNAQKKFKSWYNNTHPHILTCVSHVFPEMTYKNFMQDDDDDEEEEEEEMLQPINNDDYYHCQCIERPYNFRTCTWSLQRAIAYTTGEHLDKSHTMSRWGLGLDITLKNNMVLNQTMQNSTKLLLPQKYFQERQRLNKLQYAVNDCFAVTKLANIIRQANHPQHLPRDQMLPLLQLLQAHESQSKQKLLFQLQRLKQQQQFRQQQQFKQRSNQLQKSKQRPLQHPKRQQEQVQEQQRRQQEEQQVYQIKLQSIAIQLQFLQLHSEEHLPYDQEQELRELHHQQKRLHIIRQKYLQQQYQHLRKQWNEYHLQSLQFQQQQYAQYKEWKRQQKREQRRQQQNRKSCQTYY